MQRGRTGLALLLMGVWLAVPVAALGQTQQGTAEPRDQIVLSGDVQVRRGQEVGEVVVLHGTAMVAGVVRGDVVVLDGRIDVTGQVSGAVVSVGGSVALGPSSGLAAAADEVITTTAEASSFCMLTHTASGRAV